MKIRPATWDDEHVIEELLSAVSLPALDRAHFLPEDFHLAYENPTVVAVVGIERYGDDGLLRSLAVAPDARGQDVGRLLVDAIEEHAHAIGLRSLVLLTTTADRFFERLGYQCIARNDMPQEVQEGSSEFSTACPASAICMRKNMAACADDNQ